MTAPEAPDRSVVVCATPDARSHAYRALFDHVDLGVVYQTADGRVIDANPAASRVFGLTLDELLGRRSTDPRWQVVQDDGSPFPCDERPAMVALRTGQAVRGVLMGVVHARHGETRWITVDSFPLFAPGETAPFQVLSTFQDITEHRKADEQARRWQHIFRQTELALATADAVTNTFLDVNDTFARQRGYTVEELVGRPLIDVFAPEAREEMAARFPVINREGHMVFESIHLRKDGSRIPVLVEVTTIRDESGRALSRVAYALDNTERKRTEAAIRAADAQRQRAVEAGNVGLWSWDLRTDRVHYSPEWKRQLGYDQDEIGDTSEEWLSRLHPDDAQATEAAVLGYQANADGPFELEFRLRHRDGSYRWILAHGAVECDAGGTPTLMHGSHVDVTARKRIEEELRRFTYTVSHDLKSPIVTIRTFLGYLEKDLAQNDAARVHDDFGYIRSAAERMATLLDDLLELSRVGRRVGPGEDVSFQELVADALSAVAGPIAERGVQVNVSNAPLIVRGDRVRLVALFQNLIENAVKFMGDQTDPRVEIGVEASGAGPVLFVRDNGVGIDARHEDKLFGLFEKLHPDTPGMGIGLALVRRIAEAHGGRVWAESEGPGRGSTFRFTIGATARP
jgi:PAS domain S-box-containing protein